MFGFIFVSYKTQQKGLAMSFKFFPIILLLLTLSYAENVIDFSNTIIVTPETMGTLENKAVEVFKEEVKKRTAINLKVVNKISGYTEPLIIFSTKSNLNSINNLPKISITDRKEGFQLILHNEKRPMILVIGADSRGLFYGMGKLLRILSMEKNRIVAPDTINFNTSPQYAIRGHQLGYRAKTNAYDAWSTKQMDQYIRELAIFGANSIEIMPPKTDDDPQSSHMIISPMEMMMKQSEIADSYDMDVWIWYPNMGKDYSHPDSLKKELKERKFVFSKLKRVNAVFVPGGDPGDLHPDILFPWLKQMAKVLNKYHPTAKIWVSPQAFRPTKDWLNSFYAHVNSKYPWFGGVVFGPWIKTPLKEIREIVIPSIPIRRYPDITHTISCQYPVTDWDLAFVTTLGRECYNPRPLKEKLIHNALDEYADGSISYSEGINDDVNKFIWLSQDWDPNTSAINVMREYGRFFMAPAIAEDIAQGFIALEKNWEGPLISNSNIEITLMQWKTMEKNNPFLKENYRFKMGLMRAYYDAYIKERLVYETVLEKFAMDKLRNIAVNRIDDTINESRSILIKKQNNPIASQYKIRCWEIADFLYQKIGSQTSVKKYGAARGRGDFMDYIDKPLNDVVWYLSQFEKIEKSKNPSEKLNIIEHLLNRTNPSAGGFYFNLGSTTQLQQLNGYPCWKEDPGSLLSPRVSFGVGLYGEKWRYTSLTKGFEGSATPLAWMNQVTTLYQTPLNFTIESLDPEAEYILRVAYTGRFRSKISLTADGQYPIHNILQTGKNPIWEFPIPKKATRDGVLKLSWKADKGERGVQVAELWLIKK